MSPQTHFEKQVAPGVRVIFEAERLRYQVRSSAHEKLVIDHAHFGRMMMVDGAVQLSSADAFVHHEMMSHVPLFAHGRVERVLIVGAGDCGVAAEVLRHPGIVSVVQLESDPQLGRLAQAYFPEVNGSVFGDARFQLHRGGGTDFVATTDERFDLILADSAALGGVSLPGVTETFYRHVRGCLKPGGLLIARLGVPFIQPRVFAASMKRLATVFPKVSCYLVPVPSLFGGPLAFGWASGTLDSASPPLEVLSARHTASRIETRYYTPEVHRASFALPRYLGEMVGSAIRPQEEAEEEARYARRKNWKRSLRIPGEVQSRRTARSGGGNVEKRTTG